MHIAPAIGTVTAIDTIGHRPARNRHDICHHRHRTHSSSYITYTTHYIARHDIDRPPTIATALHRSSTSTTPIVGPSTAHHRHRAHRRAPPPPTPDIAPARQRLTRTTCTFTVATHHQIDTRPTPSRARHSSHQHRSHLSPSSPPPPPTDIDAHRQPTTNPPTPVDHRHAPFARQPYHRVHRPARARHRPSLSPDLSIVITYAPHHQLSTPPALHHRHHHRTSSTSSSSPITIDTVHRHRPPSSSSSTSPDLYIARLSPACARRPARPPDPHPPA